MKVLKAREVLSKLHDAHTMSNTIYAVLQKTKMVIVGTDPVEDTPSQEAPQGYRVQQLEVERFKAEAEEFAQRLRQRIL